MSNSGFWALLIVIMLLAGCASTQQSCHNSGLKCYLERNRKEFKYHYVEVRQVAGKWRPNHVPNYSDRVELHSWLNRKIEKPKPPFVELNQEQLEQYGPNAFMAKTKEEEIQMEFKHYYKQVSKRDLRTCLEGNNPQVCQHVYQQLPYSMRR